MVYVIEVLKAMGRPMWAEGYACARPACGVWLAAVLKGWPEVLQGDQRRPGMLRRRCRLSKVCLPGRIKCAHLNS